VRQQRRRATSNVTPAVNVPAEGVRVQANPVDTTVAPDRNTTLRGLVEGLAQASPSFKGFLEQRHEQAVLEEVKQATLDAEMRGLEGAEDGKEYWSQYRRPEAQRAYLRKTGELMARKHAAELNNAYEVGFDLETDDIDSFLASQTDGLFEAALDQPDFLEGYQPIITEQKAKLRVKHQQNAVELHKRQAADTVKQSLAYTVQDFDLFRGVEEGMDKRARDAVIKQNSRELLDVIEADRKEARDLLGVDYATTREQMIEIAKVAADNGNVELVMALLDQPLANGAKLRNFETTGLLIRKAVDRREANIRAAESELEDARKEVQDRNLASLIGRALEGGDPSFESDIQTMLAADSINPDAVSSLVGLAKREADPFIVEDPLHIAEVAESVFFDPNYTETNLMRDAKAGGMKQDTIVSFLRTLSQRKGQQDLRESPTSDPLFKSAVQAMKTLIPTEVADVPDPVAAQRLVQALQDIEEFAYTEAPEISNANERRKAYNELLENLIERYSEDYGVLAEFTPAKLSEWTALSPAAIRRLPDDPQNGVTKEQALRLSKMKARYGGLTPLDIQRTMTRRRAENYQNRSNPQ